MEHPSEIPEDVGPGDVVRLSQPCPGEEPARYVVTEWNGDRGFIRLIADSMAIPPVELVRADNVVVVKKAR
jgi:hypothetical protein